MPTLEEATEENDKLRWLLAKGSDPCIYCTLPKADMAKCESGFPGCGRADDLMVGEMKDYGRKQT
jgi:hypothetical protein